MKWLIILISTLTVVQNRPQTSHKTQPAVELEKQTIIEVSPHVIKPPDQTVHPTQRKIEENTKEILEKIAEVNKKQGLTRRKDRPNYFHFPFSYSRSQEEKKAYDRQANYFKFPNNPFSNPILEYLERERGNQNDDDDNQPQFYQKSAVNQPAIGITKEDLIPNQYVKRKIVHQQTILMPNPNLLPPPFNSMPPQPMPAYVMPTPINLPQTIPAAPPLNNEDLEKPNKPNKNKTLSNLERQTVDNVRNIVSTTQMLQSQPYPLVYNPYLQYLQRNSPDQYPYGSLITYNGATQPGNFYDDYNYQNYGIYGAPNVEKGRQNWNWPGASYFPIYIRDPFLQLYNAVTSMVEYGPNAGQAGPCKRPKNKKGKDETASREAKVADAYDKEQITFEIGDNNAPQISIYGVDGDGDKNNSNYLDIENIDIGTNNENTLKFTVNLKTGARGGKENENKALKTSWDKIVESGKPNTTARTTSKFDKFEDAKDYRPSVFFKPQTKPPAAAPTKQPAAAPAKGTLVHKDQSDDAADEEDKADDVTISNDGNKKLFSRDNTGSGIFIHKLKVRKGGVAIAGPGGIATAGSGGTAIVGPNGVAYTHPDSLAIAGSGTKVVAVDPHINLGDLISNTTGSKPSAEGFPPSRVGKVVAVGPVVYYNRG